MPSASRPSTGAASRLGRGYERIAAEAADSGLSDSVEAKRRSTHAIMASEPGGFAAPAVWATKCLLSIVSWPW